MKRIISTLLVISLIICLSITTFAKENISILGTETASIEIIRQDDGGYIVIELVTVNNNSAFSTLSTTYTRTGSKTFTKYDSDDDLEWQYTLTGTFSVVSGVSATCTNATYTTNIEASKWSFSNGSATRSGNTAYGVGTFKYKLLGFIVTDTVDIDISITCNEYGTLS